MALETYADKVARLQREIAVRQAELHSLVLGDPRVGVSVPHTPERMPGIDPKTGQYSTAQMLHDEMTMGDTSQPLFD